MTETSCTPEDDVDSDSPDLVLREDHIIATVATLRRRIEERFPGSGLSQLCGQLLVVSQRAAKRADSIGRPIRSIRAVGYLLSLCLIAILIGLGYFVVTEVDAGKHGVFDWITGLEAGLNDIIFIAIAIVFLVSLETRIKRRRALAAVHELRSIAHIIDMHQLVKNPEVSAGQWSATKNSPKRTMSDFELNRYLDYCSEMLSLTGKIAALYIQHFDDSDAVAAVSEVEQLTTGLSRKIWQKIMILEQSHRQASNAETIASSGNTQKSDA